MKINNTKNVKAIAKLLLVIILATLSIILFCYITNIYKYPYVAILLLFVTFGLILSMWRFLALKCFDLEDSGEVVSIKYFRPWKTGRITSNLEIPHKKIDGFSVKKNFFTKKLYITIHSNQDKKLLFQYDLFAFSAKQILVLKTTLQHKN